MTNIKKISREQAEKILLDQITQQVKKWSDEQIEWKINDEYTSYKIERPIFTN